MITLSIANYHLICISLFDVECKCDVSVLYDVAYARVECGCSWVFRLGG